MPVSFKVLHDPIRKTDTLIADFGESVGRVAPVDSGFWWIVLLRAYTKFTGDSSLAETPQCQKGMRLILTLCLSGGFDAFPTLLCADGCSTGLAANSHSPARQTQMYMYTSLIKACAGLEAIPD